MDPARGSDTSKACRLLPEASLAPIHLWHHSQTPQHRHIYMFMSTSVHTLHSQTTYHCCGVLYQKQWFILQSRSEGRMNPQVGRFFLAGQGDPTRDMTSILRACRNLTDWVGSGCWSVFFLISRVGSGGFQNSAGRFGRGQDI